MELGNIRLALRALSNPEHDEGSMEDLRKDL